MWTISKLVFEVFPTHISRREETMVGAFVSPRIPLVRNLASFVQRSRMHQSATSEQLACRPPMRMSGLAAKSIGSKIVLTAAIILTSLFPAPGLSARDYTSSPEPVPQIHNQVTLASSWLLTLLLFLTSGSSSPSTRHHTSCRQIYRHTLPSAPPCWPGEMYPVHCHRCDSHV